MLLYYILTFIIILKYWSFKCATVRRPADGAAAMATRRWGNSSVRVIIVCCYFFCDFFGTIVLSLSSMNRHGLNRFLSLAAPQCSVCARSCVCVCACDKILRASGVKNKNDNSNNNVIITKIILVYYCPPEFTETRRTPPPHWSFIALHRPYYLLVFVAQILFFSTLPVLRQFSVARNMVSSSFARRRSTSPRRRHWTRVVAVRLGSSFLRHQDPPPPIPEWPHNSWR